MQKERVLKLQQAKDIPKQAWERKDDKYVFKMLSLGFQIWEYGG